MKRNRTSDFNPLIFQLPALFSPSETQLGFCSSVPNMASPTTDAGGSFFAYVLYRMYNTSYVRCSGGGGPELAPKFLPCNLLQNRSEVQNRWYCAYFGAPPPSLTFLRDYTKCTHGAFLGIFHPIDKILVPCRSYWEHCSSFHNVDIFSPSVNASVRTPFFSSGLCLIVVPSRL